MSDPVRSSPILQNYRDRSSSDSANSFVIDQQKEERERMKGRRKRTEGVVSHLLSEAY
jgi:hypothetical protein